MNQLSIYCIASMLLPALAHAQLPYTSSTAVPAHISRMYEIHEKEGVVLELNTSGTGLVWDFSAHVQTDPFYETWFFEPANATPYASSFPSANLVAWYTSPDNISEYLYLNNSPFELRLLGGIYAMDGGAGTPVTYCPDPFLIMDYPMGLGSGVQQVYNCPENVDIGIDQVDNWLIIATGNVVFGEQAINNLVLWRSVFVTNGVPDTSYFWTQADNVLYPVLRYHPGGQKLRVRVPMGEEALSISDQLSQAQSFELFPNPATEHVRIHSSTLANGPVSVLIYDALGQIARQSTSGAMTNGEFQLYVGDLAAGAYTLELRSASGTMPARRAFVKE